MRLRVFALMTAAIALWSPSAAAEIEVTSNLALGGGVVLSDDPEIQGDYDTSDGVFRMGLSSSVTFLRETNRDFGLGLWAEVMTSTFHDVMPAAGLSALIPVHHGAPIVIFAGAHYDFDGQHAGGIGGRLWWGAHNHNHYRVYNTTIGIWVEVRANLWGDNRDILIAAGVDIDLHVLATPWLWFASWVRGPSQVETTPPTHDQ